MSIFCNLAELVKIRERVCRQKYAKKILFEIGGILTGGPITEKERDYKIDNGCVALEQLFGAKQLAY